MKKFITVVLFCLAATVHAEEGTVGKKLDNAGAAVKEAAQDTGKATKKAYRNAKDKGCEMINGKMECAVDKAKHTIQNGADEVKDKANDIPKKN